MTMMGNANDYNDYTLLSFPLIYNYCYLDQVNYYKYQTINKNTVFSTKKKTAMVTA